MRSLRLIFGALLVFVVGGVMGQETLVEWNFPNDPDNALADGGIPINLTQTISATGTATAAFNVSGFATNAATASGWNGATGSRYWMVNFSTQGYYSVTFSSKQRSSNTGPANFRVEYRIGTAGGWNDVEEAIISLANDNWTTGILDNINLPSVCDNQPSVFLRWIKTNDISVNGGNVASAGTSRIDDIIITGSDPCSINISSFSPATGPVGTIVTINGSGFTGVTSVKFSGIEASSYTYVSDILILATVPVGASTGTISVTGVCVKNSSTDFVVLDRNCIISSGLFISELCNPKNNYPTDRYIEIYNPTSAPINLNGWTVSAISNGDIDAPCLTWPLTGFIAPNTAMTCGYTNVVDGGTHNFTNADWYATYPNTNPNSCYYNWNGQRRDGAVLYNGAVKVDGIVRENSNKDWYDDKSLVRNSNICSPNPNSSYLEWYTTSEVLLAGSAPATPRAHSITCNPNISPVVSTHPFSQSVCVGNSVTFSVVASGGTPPLLYQWKFYNLISGLWENVSGANYTGATSTTLTINNIPATFNGNQYYCEVRNQGDGCYQASDAAQLEVNELPIVNITGSNEFCTGANTLLTANAAAGSGTITGYQWNLGGTAIPAATNGTYTATAPGSYTVTVTNSNGCSTTSVAFVVTENASPTAVIETPTTTVLSCTATSITLTATGGGTYSWSDGTNVVGEFAELKVTEPGIYTVTVTANGCTDAESIIITQSLDFRVSVNSLVSQYCNLGEAFEAINNGTHQGNITVRINGSTVEPETAVLNASGTGPAVYSSVIIFPTLSGLTVEGTVDGPMILLNGADNVRFYGYPSDPPPVISPTYPLSHVADLSIRNFSVTENASTICLQSGANLNYIEMCKISGSGTNLSKGVIFIGDVTTANNVTIRYNDISGNGNARPSNAIYSEAPSATNTTLNSGTISNNNIFNFLNPEIESKGIFLYNGSSNWTIQENSFFETMPFTSTNEVEYNIIRIWARVANGQNFNVRNNYIGGNAPMAPIGSYWIKNGDNNRFIGIYMNIGENFTSPISSNIIRSFNWTNSGVAAWTGIHLQSGRVTIGGTLKSQGNVIGLNTPTGKNSIIISNGANSTARYGADGISGIRAMSSVNVTRNINNNIIAAISTNSAPNITHQFHGIYTGRSSGSSVMGWFTISKNTIGNDEPHSISIGSPGGMNANYARGILNSADGNISFTGNTLQNISAFGIGIDPDWATSDVIGLQFVGAGGGGKIATLNYIQKLFVESPSYNSSVTGISVEEGNLSIVNNLIRLGKEVTSRSAVTGIYRAGVTGKNEIFIHFNTIAIEGEVGMFGGAPQFSDCIWLDRIPGSNVTAFLYNNILYNIRTTPNTQQSFPTNIALHINSPLYTWVNSNYNDMYVQEGPTGIKSALVAIGSPPPGVGLTTFTNLGDWSAYSFGRDANSLNLNPNFANPNGIWPEDFRPNTDLNGLSGAGGLPLIADDFMFYNIRPVLPSILPPTMGAWEMCKVIITQQPENDGGCVGENAQFTVSAIGSGPLTYQWEVSTDEGLTWNPLTETAPYSGVTSETLTITGITSEIGLWQYHCVVTTNVTSTSAPPESITIECSTSKETSPVNVIVGIPPETSPIWHR